MSIDLQTQVRDTYLALDDTQIALSVEEIIYRAGPVRPLPLDQPPVADRNWRRPLLVAAAAAVIVLVALIPVLFLAANQDQAPATTPSTITSTTLESSPTTTPDETSATTSVDNQTDGSEPIAVASIVASTPIGTWEWRSSEQPLNPDLIVGRDGVLFYPETGHFEWLDAGRPEDLAGIDTRAWLLTSTDGLSWDRQQLPTEFEAQWLWLSFGEDGSYRLDTRSWFDDGSSPATYHSFSSADGLDWTPAPIEQPAGTNLRVVATAIDGLELGTQRESRAQIGDTVVVSGTIRLVMEGAGSDGDTWLWSVVTGRPVEEIGSDPSPREIRQHHEGNRLRVELVTGSTTPTNGRVVGEVIWTAQGNSISGELIAYDGGEPQILKTGTVTLPSGLDTSSGLDRDYDTPQWDVLWVSDDGGATFDLVPSRPVSAGRYQRDFIVIAHDGRFLGYLPEAWEERTVRVDENTTITDVLPTTSIWESTDGRSWTLLSEVNAGIDGTPMTLRETTELVINDGFALWRSPDGLQWEDAQFPGNLGDYTIRPGNDLWFAIPHLMDGTQPPFMIAAEVGQWHTVDADVPWSMSPEDSNHRSVDNTVFATIYGEDESGNWDVLESWVGFLND